MAAPKELESSLNDLSLDPKPSKASVAFRQKQKIAESWEDADSSSDDDIDRPLSHQQSADYPNAPPPTPISPSTSFQHREGFVSPFGYGNSIAEARTERPAARPDKTDSVAKRMIAGALGVKAPRTTDEQRAYDRAVKEKEIRKRKEEKEAAAKAKEKAEMAKVAVWED